MLVVVGDVEGRMGSQDQHALCLLENLRRLYETEDCFLSDITLTAREGEIKGNEGDRHMQRYVISLICVTSVSDPYSLYLDSALSLNPDDPGCTLTLPETFFLNC